MTVAERDVALELYYCRCCVLHDRVTIRYADAPPTTPCKHFGTDRHSCKRMEWSQKTYFCTLCPSRTPAIHHGDPTGVACVRGHKSWELTSDTRYVLMNLPHEVDS